MSLTQMPSEVLEQCIYALEEAEGENVTTIKLKTLLRYAAPYEQPIYISAEDLHVIEAYL